MKFSDSEILRLSQSQILRLSQSQILRLCTSNFQILTIKSKMRILNLKLLTKEHEKVILSHKKLSNLKLIQLKTPIILPSNKNALSETSIKKKIITKKAIK